MKTAISTSSAMPGNTIAQQGMGIRILAMISLAHLLNDLLQSLVPAVYPLLKEEFSLTFTQIGLITLVYQIFASLLQPVIGIYTDYRPKPYFLAIGMGSLFLGLLGLALAPSYLFLLLAVSLMGIGSSVFHPESSRVARMASAGRFGLAQSLFQVGGNIGSSAGPLLAALVLVPLGRATLFWFSLVAMAGIILLWQVGKWYKLQILRIRRQKARSSTQGAEQKKLAVRAILWPLFLLLLLIFSKFFYTAGLNSYLTFYMISKFQVSVSSAQLYLFVLLFGSALGAMIGGPIGDKIGRSRVIRWSILGAAPFALILPHASLFWTGPLVFLIGLIIASAFPAILVYGQELIPGKIGMVSGLFFGLAFGFAGLGAAFLGKLADAYSIEYVYRICAWLPLLGGLAIMLPDINHEKN